MSDERLSTYKLQAKVCSALISKDWVYRYSLLRTWGQGRRMLFVMLNPSTADGETDDPTTRRCEGRARSVGYGAYAVVNLFAFRATNPRELRRATDPVGPLNDEIIARTAESVDLIVVAWGAHGEEHADRVAVVLGILKGRELWCLGKTKAGHPRHPLYVPNKQELERFNA